MAEKICLPASHYINETLKESHMDFPPMQPHLKPIGILCLVAEYWVLNIIVPGCTI